MAKAIAGEGIHGAEPDRGFPSLATLAGDDKAFKPYAAFFW
jgi:hypothetical protein